MQLQIPPCLPATPKFLSRLNSSLVSTFSTRRSASGHFWFIRPSTSFNQAFPSSLVMNVSGFSKKPPRFISQKGCSFAAALFGKLDIVPLINGRNSCCTCEWPNRKATLVTENEGHQETKITVANSLLTLGSLCGSYFVWPLPICRLYSCIFLGPTIVGRYSV